MAWLKSKYLLTVVILIITSLSLTGCGAQGNSGKPSKPRNLAYTIDKDIIRITWDEPEENFNFVEEDEENDRNYFYLDLEGQISGSFDTKIGQIKGKTSYEYFLSNYKLLNNYKDIVTLRLRAFNDQYFDNESEPVFLDLKLPEVTEKPSMKTSNFVQVRQSNNLLNFCNFLNLDWNNQALYYMISYSGALNGQKKV